MKAMARQLKDVWAVCTFTTILFVLMGALVEAQETLTYNVVEEEPPLTYLGNMLLDSNLAGSVSQSDRAAMSFRLLSVADRDDTGYLWINETSGELRTADRIDREDMCPRQIRCELHVQVAVQAVNLFEVFNVYVIVTDLNDNSPRFDPSTFTIKVSEIQAPGTTFRLPTAIDPDGGPGHSVIGYNQTLASPSPTPFNLIVSGGSSQEQFEVVLRLVYNLDREAAPRYQILVEAVDGGSSVRKTGTLTVDIEVEDVNDNPPRFGSSEYTVNISESTPVGDVVATVSASDPDAAENGAVTYSLPAASQEDIVLTLFAIDAGSGQVRTLIPLDSYAGRTYRLVVEARDGGTNPQLDTTEVVISVVDTHNSAPQIRFNLVSENGVAQVSEKAMYGRVVALVDVTDPDSALSPNGQVSCFVVNNLFELDPMTATRYAVKLTGNLDYETEKYHSVTVTCRDAGLQPLQESKQLTVQVMDENDNNPVFKNAFYNADVVEGLAGIGSSGAVMVLNATDRDSGDNAKISYRLADNADSDFGIYADGSLVVTNPNGVDREDPIKGDVREVVVIAVDGGNPPKSGNTTVRIQIRDVNDNAPIFTDPAFYFSVPEDADYEQLVDTVSATDPDLEINSIFYFKLADDDDGSSGNHGHVLSSNLPFRVTLDGEVRVDGPLDREKVASYAFRVKAYDLGQPLALTSTVTVHITITDINDNTPVFVFPSAANKTVHVPHTLGANTAFSQIYARDADAERNGDIIYARDGGNGSAYFDVDAISGQLILTRSLTESQLGLHVISVTARDRGHVEQHAAHSILHIIVYEGNATSSGSNGDGDGGIGFRNVVVVVVLLVVTVVLSLAILLTIVLIRRVDRQRRRYHAKGEEIKADSNLRRLNVTTSSTLTAGLPSSSSSTHSAASSTASSPTPHFPPDGGLGGPGKKKKEVSFSLDDENRSGPTTLATFAPPPPAPPISCPDKYDAIADSERGKIKPELFSSNHFQADRLNKTSGAKKDLHNFNFHQPSHPSHPHDDNLSDVSGEVSTSDSGRGGSDVELQSHGGVSKESGDTSFASQRGYNPHNNLNTTLSNGSGSMGINHGSNSNINSHHPSHPKPSGGGKSVHFQNIHPEPTVGLGTFLPPRPPRGVNPAHNGSNSRLQPSPVSSNSSRFTPNLFPDDSGSYVKLANHGGRLASCSPSPILEAPSRKTHPAIQMDTFSPNRNQRFGSGGPAHYMAGGRASFTSQGSNQSVSGIDGAGTWDGDTTTSGSYTVDAVELCDEIDKLFFDEIQDVVV